jgi:hypothetical protein
MRTALRRRPVAVLLTALLAALPFVLAACGGGAGGDEQDAEALLDRAFSRTVPSADVDIDAELDIRGLKGFEKPIQISASGPYVSAKRALPKLDMDIDVGQGTGQDLQVGLLSTGKRVFVKFGGSFFEQPPDQIAAANRRLAKQEQGKGSLSELGLHPRDWVVNASVTGDEDIGGTQTEHVEGELDVAALVTDLNGLVKQSAGALGGSGQAPKALRKRDIDRLADTVDNPTFDVYVGKDDDVVRRISLRLDIDVPKDDQADVQGVTGAGIKFSAELSDIGGDQQVKAPTTSSPISVLTDQIGSLAGLTGLGGANASATPDNTTTTPSSGSGTGGSGPGDAEDFERYGQCLEQAQPDDTDAIARCAQLVN